MIIENAYAAAERQSLLLVKYLCLTDDLIMIGCFQTAEPALLGG